LIVAIQYGIWALSLAVQTIIAGYILQRRRVREYPWFFFYTIYSATKSLLLLGLLQLYRDHKLSYRTYFNVFWTCDIISLVLCVAIAYTIVSWVFRDFSILRRYASVAFGIALMGLLIGAILLTHAAGNHEQRFLGTTLILNRSLLFVQVGLLILICAFSNFAAIPWQTDPVFGIALGFGIQAGTELLAVVIRTHLGHMANIAYQWLRSASYVVALLIWFLYIRAPQVKPAAEQLPDFADVEPWNRTLAEMLKE
jgi:hypothetical protein